MEAALDVLRGLGASVEDTRIRPMQDYYDVKVTIAESELFAIHASELRARPQDFGRDFRGRVLPACLMSGADYVNAQRERRVMLAQMAPLYEKYDVLVTAGVYGPAGRLGVHRTVAFWEKPSIATPFNVTGGPALAQCIGFSEDGLPLSMQIVGRPFDEATVLRAAHAYEQATPWRNTRPDVGAAGPLAEAPAEPPSLDKAYRDRVTAAVAQAGLSLSDEDFAQILAAAPHVEAMVGRLRRKRGYGEEPGNTFAFDAG
jgi:aspartyl-tRNA(Asn)/glutamyl-tRNA(Gln) amidotransferase subunit A